MARASIKTLQFLSFCYQDAVNLTWYCRTRWYHYQCHQHSGAAAVNTRLLHGWTFIPVITWARYHYQCHQHSGITANITSETFINYLSTKVASNEKGLNYKVVDLVEIYNFYIKFISIQVHMNYL